MAFPWFSYGFPTESYGDGAPPMDVPALKALAESAGGSATKVPRGGRMACPMGISFTSLKQESVGDYIPKK